LVAGRWRIVGERREAGQFIVQYLSVQSADDVPHESVAVRDAYPSETFTKLLNELSHAVIREASRHQLHQGRRGVEPSPYPVVVAPARAQKRRRVIIDTGDDLGLEAVDKTHTA
jgi:hypothetical protein